MSGSRTFLIVEEAGTDLSSRSRAAALRAKLLKEIDDSRSIVLDFSNVRTVSHSFADELFAVLVATHGEEWFRTWFTLRGLGQDVRATILEAVSERLAQLH